MSKDEEDKDVEENNSAVSLNRNEVAQNNRTKTTSNNFTNTLLEKCSDFTQKTSAFLTPLENNRRASLNVLKTNFERRKTLHHRVKSWIAPSDTPANAKIFGGRRAVQEEQIRSKNAGWIIHPYSSLR